MRNILSIFTIIVIIIGLNSSCCPICEKSQKRFKFENNSDKAVYYGLSYSYPDTGVNKIDNKPYNGYKAHKINSHDFSDVALGFKPTMQMFIFDADVIEKEPWDSIAAHYKVLKRYQYTESDLQSKNWTLTFP